MQEAPSSPASRTTLRFSDFEVDLRAGELRKQGVRVKLQEQPFQILQALLEHPGEVVTREELQRRIWPADTFVDFDHGLYNAIKRLREALGDTAGTPQYIETLPKRGYRFIGTLNGNGGPAAPPEETTTASAKGDASAKRRMLTALALCAIAIAAAVVYFWTRPPGVPIVESITQLTNDFIPKQLMLVTDGSRIYFGEGTTGSWKLAQVSIIGGETSVIPTRLENPQIMGITPDGSTLLALDGETNAVGSRPLWAIPLPTGQPHRLGTFEAVTAATFPDGRLLFAQDAELYVADRGGLNARKLLTVPGPIACPVASPDGTRIVIRTFGPSNAFFEAAADGSGLHKIMGGMPDAGIQGGCPHWTPDGRYLLYVGGPLNGLNIWAIAPRGGVARGFGQPTQLTNGPVSYEDAIPSRDGKHIFAIGTEPRSEVVRYDSNTKQFVPFLGGISAVDPSFSRDGQWVTYTSYSDHTLWRSRADGTDRLQLTFPPTQASFPILSPDGRQVAFMTPFHGTYVVSMDGGPPREIAGENSSGGSISPDGNLVAFTVSIEGKHRGEKNIWQLKTLDLRTGVVADVPSSQGKLGVIWVTQDTLVAANEDFNKLLTFSFKSGRWEEFVSGAIVNWMPSPDGTYMYYATGGVDPKAMRVKLADRKVEEIVSLKGLRRVVDTVDFSTQISVAPDGSPVFTRDLGTKEIYSLAVKWP